MFDEAAFPERLKTLMAFFCFSLSLSSFLSASLAVVLLFALVVSMRVRLRCLHTPERLCLSVTGFCDVIDYLFLPR